jgi:hypothetical protein
LCIRRDLNQLKETLDTTIFTAARLTRLCIRRGLSQLSETLATRTILTVTGVASAVASVVASAPAPAVASVTAAVVSVAADLALYQAANLHHVSCGWALPCRARFCASHIVGGSRPSKPIGGIIAIFI